MKRIVYFLCFILMASYYAARLKPICHVEKCNKCDLQDENKCIQCMSSGYILNEGKCYNAEKFANFLNNLKNTANEKEKSILDFIMKDVKLNNIASNETQSDNDKFELISKDFHSIREILSNLQQVNERECRMKINEFMVNFEQNMQVLLSLTNLIEQKTIFEIEKKRNAILQLINAENVEPNSKFEIISQKLEELYKMVRQAFESIKSKITNYEDISEKKIARAKNSFMIKIKKFLN